MGQWWAESGDVLEVEESNPGGILNVRCKWEGAVQDDAEAPDLGGGKGTGNPSMMMGYRGVLWFGEVGFWADEQGLGLLPLSFRKFQDKTPLALVGQLRLITEGVQYTPALMSSSDEEVEGQTHTGTDAIPPSAIVPHLQLQI